MPPGQRIERRPLHGVLLLDKPRGLSSNDALQVAKRLLRAEKAGHTGTLDPMADGLLPLCFGAATKFSQVSLDADKSYRAEIRLGVRTTTGDAEGEVLEERPVHLQREAIEQVILGFKGDVDQLPPMHSALKRDGKALYEYARQGIVLDREPRRVTLHSLEVVAWDAEQPHRLVLDVRCSKGTYIRTLAEDIGLALGCGASLTGLRRTQSGPLSVEQAVTLDALRGMSERERDALMLPVDALLRDWPSVDLNAAEAARFLTGLRRRVDLPNCPAVRVYGPDPAAAFTDEPRLPQSRRVLLGSAHVQAGELIADRLLSPHEIQTLYPSTPAVPVPAPNLSQTLQSIES